MGRGRHDFDGGVRWRGKLVVPSHAHPIVRRLIREANAQRTTLTEIAHRAGVRRCSIMQWGHRYHPRLDQVQAALNVLDLDLYVGPKGAGAVGYKLAVMEKETPPAEPEGQGHTQEES
jgi:hypothetical protein